MTLSKIELADQFAHQRLVIGTNRVTMFILVKEARRRVFPALGWPEDIVLMFSRKGKNIQSDAEGRMINPEVAYQISQTEVFEYLDGFHVTFDHMNSVFINALVTLGDLLKTNPVFNITPETEFLRHLRNGAAHNNRFHFIKNEPVNEPEFNGFKLTSALQGFQILSTGPGDYYIDHGDILDLFDSIEGQLRA